MSYPDTVVQFEPPKLRYKCCFLDNEKNLYLTVYENVYFYNSLHIVANLRNPLGDNFSEKPSQKQLLNYVKEADWSVYLKKSIQHKQI